MSKVENKKEGDQVADSKARSCQVPDVPVTLDIEHLRLVHGSSYGTSGCGVIEAHDQIPADNLHKMSLWLTEISKSNVDFQVLLPQGIELLKRNFADLNSIKHLFGRFEAVRDIQVGSLLHGVKKVTKKLGHKWGSWSEENLPFIGKRTRERMMKLARRTDVHPLAVLGVDRLDILCAATESLVNDDPNAVKNFMIKHGIQFDPTKEFDLDEFKRQVDAALNMDRLQKAQLTIDPQLVYNLTVTGIKIDKALIRKLIEIQESGGDIAVSLKKLSINRGQSAPEDESEKRLADFNTLSNRLIKTIDYLVTGVNEEIDRVDVGTFSTLMKKLVLFQKVANISEEISKAA